MFFSITFRARTKAIVVEIPLLALPAARRSLAGSAAQLLGEVRLTARQITVQFLTLCVQIGMLFRTFREGDVRQFFDICIRHRHIETVADVTHAVHVHFLNLVRDVFTFSRVAHAVTFNGMSKDYCRFAFGFLRFLNAA
ncbi:hypothetical protein ACVXG9_15820 [Escherichia coli]